MYKSREELLVNYVYGFSTFFLHVSVIHHTRCWHTTIQIGIHAKRTKGPFRFTVSIKKHNQKLDLNETRLRVQSNECQEDIVNILQKFTNISWTGTQCVWFNRSQIQIWSYSKSRKRNFRVRNHIELVA